MKIERVTKASFKVIGKEGSTREGEGFIGRLWQKANEFFGEIAHLAKVDENGVHIGVWGAMSDFSRSFQPWEENFSQGLYLAGAECYDGAQAPEGWTKWVIPGYEYLAASGEKNLFAQMLAYLKQQKLSLVGAMHDFTNPKTGENYMYFPIRKL